MYSYSLHNYYAEYAQVMRATAQLSSPIYDGRRRKKLKGYQKSK